MDLGAKIAFKMHFPTHPLQLHGFAMRSSGRHFLQLPGPTNVPLPVLSAIAQPTVDHRGPDFPALTFGILEGMKAVFRTSADVVIYPASGTGAWEAALVNTLSPGDAVLMAETGHFSTLWKNMAAASALRWTFLRATGAAAPILLRSRLG